ncbi:TetR/AcrR family transcriptional regulator [Homoserinibacter sp. YIM 151385]|uniref:TetR/AcrR family transcriptional regulator n=1 Tax=Homoserinibacter sp. YIM 151385 TaxID=2985506 RepID=UPI0022F04DC8|nr:TetR family transcriptional regulator C-terminal domain-containing protein [Homoserinibacter sp. YIM 151385]WBU38270.1 TetR family transcriptional regulator C-terminal domain-containing protein [Homoserinibacter sp. YIM 151385]
MSANSPLPLDLTGRQEALADAALTVISSGGMAALSFRTVAATAKCSVGSVQKAFPTKLDMIAAAFSRLRQVAVPLPQGEPGRPTLREWLTELAVCILPLDEARAAAQRQAEAFAQHAMNDPAIAHALAASDDHLRDLFSKLVDRAKREGEVSRDIDAERTGWAILALLQGAATQLAYQPRPEAEVRDRVDAAVHQLLRDTR